MLNNFTSEYSHNKICSNNDFLGSINYYQTLTICFQPRPLYPGGVAGVLCIINKKKQKTIPNRLHIVRRTIKFMAVHNNDTSPVWNSWIMAHLNWSVSAPAQVLHSALAWEDVSRTFEVALEVPDELWCTWSALLYFLSLFLQHLALLLPRPAGLSHVTWSSPKVVYKQTNHVRSYHLHTHETSHTIK